VNFSELVVFVGLVAVVGFAGGLFAIGGALIAIPLLTAVWVSIARKGGNESVLPGHIFVHLSLGGPQRPPIETS
jgi:uncharacterized membrane protein YfcA